MRYRLNFTAGAHSGTSISDSQIYTVDYQQNLNGYGQFGIGVVATAMLKLTSQTALAEGEEFDFYCTMMDQAETKIGHFIVTDVRNRNNLYDYTCLDNMHKCDVVVDSWFQNASTWQNTTGQTLFASLMSHLGLTGSWSGYNNSFPISKKFDGKNISGKTILRLLAEVACCNCYVDKDGVITIKPYVSNSININNARYTKKTVENFTCPAIDKITLQRDYSGDNQWQDIVKTGTSGTNILKISDSYFNYQLSTSTLATYYQNAFGWLPSYTPMTVELQRDFGINAGDIIRVDGVQTLVMSKRITNKGVTLQSTGVSQRSEFLALNQESIDLTGYLKQQDYDTGLVNTSGYYSTAGITVTGTKQISGVDYTLNTAVNANGLLATATYGTETNTCGVQTSNTLPKLYIEKNTGLTASSLSLSSTTIEHTGTDGSIFELTGTDGLVFGTNNQLFAVYPTKAEDSWWYVYGTRNTTSEPSGYTAWPSHIWPSAVRFFILALAKGTTGAESTSYDRYDWYCYKIFPAMPRGFNKEIQVDLTYNSNIIAHCKINFANYTFKVWGSVTSGPAPVLFAYY